MNYNSIKEGQFVRVRRLTPEECLRFMGMREKYLRRIMHPREELSQEGYTVEQINRMLRFAKSQSEFSDYALYGRAGNSIIVDVIAAIFSEIIRHGYISPEKSVPDTVKERRRIASKSYYERNKDKIRRRSREYHRERRRQFKLAKEKSRGTA